jgi:5'-phosphate synthase pdxT subunit
MLDSIRRNHEFNFQTQLVRTAEDLDLSKLDALIIPGGESTTMALVAERSGCLHALKEFVRVKPTWVRFLYFFTQG